jgi:hypothetical protein
LRPAAPRREGTDTCLADRRDFLDSCD